MKLSNRAMAGWAIAVFILVGAIFVVMGAILGGDENVQDQPVDAPGGSNTSSAPFSSSRGAAA
ncbi:hypothetical protein [Nocardioides dongkuii]|uniref:hypothetical protein n=1 Tax=Nocardioides dongkuii TaxID=2760089 RepID=UPI0015FCED8D|nr:hypothetical protein [Nocardioides dongkuii]